MTVRDGGPTAEELIPDSAAFEVVCANPIRRMWEQVALIEKVGLNRQIAILALRTSDLAAKDKVALSLRGELKKLRDNQKATLARVEVADLAITMIESAARERFNGIGEELLCLLRELLDVDRHRKKIAANPKLMQAAMHDGLAIQGGRILGVRELARRVGVTPRAVVDWRRSPIYHKEVAMGFGVSPRTIAALFATFFPRSSRRQGRAVVR